MEIWARILRPNILSSTDIIFPTELPQPIRRNRYNCREGEYIVFVEIKARSQSFAGLAREAVDLRKQKKIIKTALMYLSQYEKNAQPRFDVVEVNQIGREYRVNHIENAFDLRGYDEAF